MPERRQQRDDH